MPLIKIQSVLRRFFRLSILLRLVILSGLFFFLSQRHRPVVPRPPQVSLKSLALLQQTTQQMPISPLVEPLHVYSPVVLWI
ncbi:hypothetical protein SAMN05216522_102200 [Rosenbergiella nectarea]|uniref:Uncharacterized protein n=1 Tax=Rosenbergiella nectarea TaxID=988801 RepID=A0A1H9F9I6_9GAMM|nr:hypothetical protein SAMN05216522_102200 [Rosenbergiella nectarea]